MMKQAAGVLLFRRRADSIEVLIAHPGGPFFAKKDAGVWSIIKGEFEAGEDGLMAARREFQEETGRPLPDGELIELGSAKVPGKTNHIWALEADFDASHISSNTLTLEWPPRSGRQTEFPEMDRVGWFDPLIARDKLRVAQLVFLERLLEHLCLPALAGPEQTSTEKPRLF